MILFAVACCVRPFIVLHHNRGILCQWIDQNVCCNNYQGNTRCSQVNPTESHAHTQVPKAMGHVSCFPKPPAWFSIKGNSYNTKCRAVVASMMLIICLIIQSSVTKGHTHVSNYLSHVSCLTGNLLKLVLSWGSLCNSLSLPASGRVRFGDNKSAIYKTWIMR